MRLPDDRFARLARVGLIALFAAALGGCAMFAGDGDIAALEPAYADAPVRAAGTGPSADYPVVIGEPYRVGSKLYTPADTLNYDEVGYVAADSGNGVSGAHHTLPLPSYAEVTSLDSGRTILVRLERRGPMTSDALVGLSPAAMTQLGASAGTPVRLRRVNPPEDERTMLRAGQSVPPRMDTPEALLAVLKRKLPGGGAVLPSRSATPAALPAVAVAPSAANRGPTPSLVVAQQPGERRPLPAPPLPPLQTGAAAAPARATGQPVVVASLPPQAVARPEQAIQPVEPARQEPVAPRVAAEGAYVVQVAALSSLDRAQRVAGAIGGHVEPIGRLYRIRTGPFATRSQAEASLAKVRAAGYSEARIFTNG